MTIYAAPPRTLAVERHNDALWLCAVSGDRSELLARFSDAAQAEAFKTIHAASLAYAQANGALGI